MGKGLYILNADQSDALGRGDTESTGGISFAPSTSSPYRISLGRDDGNLYVNSFATADATTWVYDPDVTTATNLFPEVGQSANPSVHTDAASTPTVTGSLAAGNLKLYNNDGSAPGDLNAYMRWDIGGSLPYNLPPTQVCLNQWQASADVVGDTEMGPDGKFYCAVYPATGTEPSGLRVYAADGTTVLWSSVDLLGSPDPLKIARALTLSPDHTLLCLLMDDNRINLFKLTNGVPDWASRFIITQPITTTSARDVAMDIAGNIYTVSSGQTLLRVWSVGGQWIASTGSAGTFDISTPLPVATVTAVNPVANEEGPVPGTFTIARTGDTSQALTVYYTMSGTASNGVDYLALSGSVILPANASSTNLTLTPIQDGVSELTETATLSLVANTNYTFSVGSSATVSIIDRDPAQLVLSVLQPTMYERLANDFITFQISRKGQTNSTLTVNISYSGTATNSVDYTTAHTQVTLPAGAGSTNFIVGNPQDNTNLTGNLSVIATITSGSYQIGTPASATGFIIDDELPVENILFADPLTSDTSTNWHVSYGSNNGIDDEQIVFANSLSGDLVPAAPNGSDSALRLTVNKSEGSAGGAAALNLYPIGQTFNGDYALRFNLYLSEGTATSTASEYAIFGLNHSGTATNWILESAYNAANPSHFPFGGDGVFASILCDGSGSAPGDYSLITAPTPTNFVAVTSASAASLTNVLKKSLFYTAGVPASIASFPQATWVDVELKTVGGVITMSINKTPILTYTNTTHSTNGNIMLGYMDPYDSIGQNGFVYYSNVRVVGLASLKITKVNKAASTVTIKFTGDPADPATAFHVQSSGTITNFLDDATANITSLGAGSFQATVPVNGTNRFYRIRR